MECVLLMSVVNAAQKHFEIEKGAPCLVKMLCQSWVNECLLNTHLRCICSTHFALQFTARFEQGLVDIHHVGLTL